MSLALQSKIAAKRQSKDSLWGNTKGPSSKAFTFFASSYVPLLLISRFVLDKNSQWNASIFATKIDQKIPFFCYPPPCCQCLALLLQILECSCLQFKGLRRTKNSYETFKKCSKFWSATQAIFVEHDPWNCKHLRPSLCRSKARHWQ